MARFALVIALVPLLAACAGGSASYVRPATPAAAGTPPTSAVRAPETTDSRESGLVGALAATLTSRFGTPRIDLAEGDARKLQFASTDCVLDVFLYPAGAGAEPVATHVEARDRQDGKRAPIGECIARIERAARE